MSETAERVFIELGDKEDKVTISSALYLMVGLRGPAVSGYDDFAGFRLDLPGLLFLEALTGAAKTVGQVVEEVEARLGINATALMSLAEELRRRQLLVPARLDRPVPPDAAELGAEEPDDDETEFVYSIPTTLVVSDRGFEQLDHDGAVRARLSAAEVHAATRFCEPSDVAKAFAAHSADSADAALPEEAFRAMVRRLRAAEILVPRDPDDPRYGRAAINRQRMRDRMQRTNRIRQFDLARVVEFEDNEATLRAETGFDRVRVIGLDAQMQPPPAALGYLVAYAKAFDGGRLNDTYAFYPRFFFPDLVEVDEVAAGGGLFLFSNYVWSVDENLAMSARVKERNPAAVTIHGGPSTPKYVDDAEQFFADHTHVDIIVRGEGEETFAHLLSALEPGLRSGAMDLSALEGVEGLTYRTADGCRRNDDRDRIAELDTIPSPILTGLMDAYAAGPVEHIVLETNRGCPYGCTFCDWGSATASRIRKFDLDRVYAELEWIGRNHIWNIGIADANFGIFARDVDIAERIVALKREHGFPGSIGPNYAKNTVKHLRPIIEAWADAGILAEGKVSLQSMDDDTLKVIRRKNIKTEKYNQLSEEFRENGLPLSVDIMMGLPGATVGSFRNDLQGVINRDVMAVIHETQLLPNSPMNDAAYRAEHGIVAKVGEIVRSTNAFTEDEWSHMAALRSAAYVFDTAGVARVVAKYVRHETGMREIDFYDRMVTDVLAHTERWPALSWALRGVRNRMLPPGSWRLLVDDLHDYVLSIGAVADDDALASILAVQHAVLPMTGRRFPYDISLRHDVATWHDRLMDVRGAGHHDDWEQQDIPRLRDLGPADFSVTDPIDACGTTMGQDIGFFLQHHLSWDLRSGVARAQIEPIGLSG